MTDAATSADDGGTVPGAESADAESQKPVPYRMVLGKHGVRVLAGSRLTSRMGQTTLNYGSMVYLSMAGATQLQISLVGSSSYFAPLFFGVQGGSVADSLSKRIALMFGFAAQAALCILTALLIGTSVGSLMFLMFMTSLLMQVVTPSLKAAVAVVSSPAELASVNAIVTLVGSVGSAIGSTMIAPVLISVSGIDAVLYVAGALFAIGALRVSRLGGEADADARNWRSIEWKPRAVSLRANADWINSHRPIATMILTGSIVMALFEAFNTLIPVYVRDVLDSNPAHAVYIFAPAGVGFFIATILAPRIILRFGERVMAVASLGCLTAGMVLFGLIDIVAPVLSIISPLRILELFGMQFNDKVLAASVIAIPANFGSTGAGAAVDNFVNRYVPVAHQGATFGLKEVQDNGLTIFTILVLGVISSVVGPRAVMIVAPVIVTLTVLRLLMYSTKRAGEEVLTRREAFDLLTSGGEQLPAKS